MKLKKMTFSATALLSASALFADFPAVMNNGKATPAKVIEELGEFPLDDQAPMEYLLKTERGYEVVVDIWDDVPFEGELVLFNSKEKPKRLKSQTNGFYDIEADGRVWKGRPLPLQWDQQQSYDGQYIPVIASVDRGVNIDREMFKAMNKLLSVEMDAEFLEETYQKNSLNKLYELGNGYSIYLPFGGFYYWQGGAGNYGVIFKDGVPQHSVDLYPSEKPLGDDTPNFGLSPDGQYFEYMAQGGIGRIKLDGSFEATYHKMADIQPVALRHDYSGELHPEE